MEMRRVVRCLWVVGKTFPIPSSARKASTGLEGVGEDGENVDGGAGGQRMTRSATREIERKQEREETNEVSELWVCTICFEGVALDLSEESAASDGRDSSLGETSEDTAESDVCQLRCGHQCTFSGVQND